MYGWLLLSKTLNANKKKKRQRGTVLIVKDKIEYYQLY